MSKEDAKKNVFKESLATRTPISSYASSSSSSSNLPPPPIRTVVPVISGLGSAKALYDYPGTVSFVCLLSTIDCCFLYYLYFTFSNLFRRQTIYR